MRNSVRFKRVASRCILMVMLMSVLMTMLSVTAAFAAPAAPKTLERENADKTKTVIGTCYEYSDIQNYLDDKGYDKVNATTVEQEVKDKNKLEESELTPGMVYVKVGGKWVKEAVIASIVTNSNVDALDVNVSADVNSANELVSGFEPVINLIIGIIAWAIVIGLPLITAIDVAYITIPFFREKAEDVKAQGGAMTKQGKDGATKLRFISDEAQYAVSDIDLENGSSPLKKYLKTRIGAFIMVAIILYLLIGGQITVVTQLAVRLVSGIMSILSGLGK